MTRIRFQQRLEDLKENLLVMAGLAEQAIQRAIEAYRLHDLSICDQVDRSEIAINRMERAIDQASLDLLAMEQPMASDLRFILSVIKINADLERVGDVAKTISDRVRLMEKMAAVDLPVDIPRMSIMAAEMVRKSLQAFIETDADLAHSVLTMDEAVDQMNRSAYLALIKVMEEQGSIAPQALNALMISRALERVADHATNIAEDIIFWLEGSDVRHPKSVAKMQAALAKASQQATPEAAPAPDAEPAPEAPPRPE
jgi:phosphate transport system protein